MENQFGYYRKLLQDEVVQRLEEGCDIDGFALQVEKANDVLELHQIYADLSKLVPSPRYVEPSTLPEILKSCPPGIGRLQITYPEAELQNRILGGWLGRCAGCQLGKPVEGWAYDQIRDHLQRAGDWPLTHYISERLFSPEERKEFPGMNTGSTREHLRIANRDDDQDYSILGLNILEEYGFGFTTEQVGVKWQLALPYQQVYTAERQAYRNLVEGYTYPETATRWNPYREWIGAQIRADSFGYCAPGWPRKAAELAYRDAALSHVKNGIYGEMFMAAMISTAYIENDIQKCIQSAAAEIPTQSRFSEMVQYCLNWASAHQEWEDARAEVAKKYGRYHGVHTINNAALVILALLYGQKDFETTVCLAVSGGWDTDCNGATAGSILGIMLGAQALPPKWIAPLNDTIQSAVFGFGEARISDLAHRTFKVAKKGLSSGENE